MNGFSLSISGRLLTNGRGAVILDASGVLKLFGWLSCAPILCGKIKVIKKTRISIILFVLAVLSPLAHASLATGAHEFKNDVKTAGKKSGHAVRDAAHAVGHGTKKAGHAVADATRHGYHATKKLVTGHG
jgi:hypothetical protein